MKIAEFLEREAGHIVICFLLFIVGAILIKIDILKGEDIIMISIGTLGRSMLGHNGNGKTDPSKTTLPNTK